jgi:hypothetical protein
VLRGRSGRIFKTGELGMTKRIAIVVGALLLAVTAAPIRTLADDLFIYPTRGQSAEQQQRDTWECRAWATNQTGFDPAARPRAITPPPAQQAPRGGALRGAAGGAGIGAIGGAIGGNAGRGAAIGALGGGVLGAVRRNDQIRDQQFAQQQWAQQNVAHHEQNRSAWVRGVRACLTGRGYTVQ